MHGQDNNSYIPRGVRVFAMKSLALIPELADLLGKHLVHGPDERDDAAESADGVRPDLMMGGEDGTAVTC